MPINLVYTVQTEINMTQQHASYLQLFSYSIPLSPDSIHPYKLKHKDISSGTGLCAFRAERLHSLPLMQVVPDSLGIHIAEV